MILNIHRWYHWIPLSVDLHYFFDKLCQPKVQWFYVHINDICTQWLYFGHVNFKWTLFFQRILVRSIYLPFRKDFKSPLSRWTRGILSCNVFISSSLDFGGLNSRFGGMFYTYQKAKNQKTCELMLTKFCIFKFQILLVFYCRITQFPNVSNLWFFFLVSSLITSYSFIDIGQNGYELLMNFLSHSINSQHVFYQV